jgi:hypothetical protein
MKKAHYPCAVYAVVTEKGSGINYYWKMPRRWWADPLNPWFLVQLIFWLPVNVIYFSFQGVRSLASTRRSLSPPVNDVAQLSPGHLNFSRPHAGLGAPIPYARISSLNYYANGLLIDVEGRSLLVDAVQKPSLFVALRHLAPNASVISGLIVPNGFIERCIKGGRQIDVGLMRQNPPQTWRAEPKDYKPQIPAAALVGYGLMVIFAVLIIALFV